MRCSCGAHGFRGHMLMVRRGAYPAHVFYPVPWPIKKPK